jgi:hypothetical protein
LGDTRATLSAERDRHEQASEQLLREVEELRHRLAEAEEAARVGPSEPPGDEDRLIESSHTIRRREAAARWHDLLVALVLELHETVTVALFELPPGIVLRRGDSSRWEAISSCVHRLHLHSLAHPPGAPAPPSPVDLLRVHRGRRPGISSPPGEILVLRAVVKLLLRAWRARRRGWKRDSDISSPSSALSKASVPWARRTRGPTV